MADQIASGPPVEIQMRDLLEQMLLELRGVRLALVHMATQDGKASPDDFDMTSPINEQEVLTNLS